VAPAWPYLTADIAPVSAGIKRHDEDFVVEEIPLYDPCGSGDHVYALIEKMGMTTRRAVLEIARAVGVSSTAIGVAGQKDAHGITRQVLSIEGVEPSRVQALDLLHLRVLDVARHRAKLRPGALRGNRFRVRLREVSAARVGEVRHVLEVLARRGVPNYFGPQRFGMRGDT
jgi:tRNA pseudouridine13 synthase